MCSFYTNSILPYLILQFLFFQKKNYNFSAFVDCGCDRNRYRGPYVSNREREQKNGGPEVKGMAPEGERRPEPELPGRKLKARGRGEGDR